MKPFAIGLLVLMSLGSLVSLGSTTSWASRPDDCPAPENLSKDNCSLPYNGIALLAGIVGLPSARALNKAADLLDEVTSGSDDAVCAPRLTEMTKKIQDDRKGCHKADLQDISEIIAKGNDDKVFCRREESSKEISFDLYNEKRIRNYVMAQLHEQHPELCQ